MEYYSNRSVPKSLTNDNYAQHLVNQRIESFRALKKSLLSFFIEYTWDHNDGEYSSHADKKLETWIKSQRLDLNQVDWFFSTSLKIRLAPRVELERSLMANDQLWVWRKAMEFNDDIISAKLAYALRQELPLLINCKEDIHYKNDKGDTILHVFLKKYVDAQRVLLGDQVTRTVKLIKNLMDNGALLFDVNNCGETPFQIATMLKNVKIIKTLISNSNINERDQSGDSALHMIIEKGVDEIFHDESELLELVQILVSRGANVNSKNNEGITPVHLAARKFHTEVLKYFLNNNAEFCQRTIDYETPLHMACRSSLKLANTSKMVETITLLVSQGCTIYDANTSGYTALHYAAMNSTVEIIEKLTELATFVDFRTITTLYTPLYLAARADHLGNMMALVRVGADVNAEAVDGTTPLFMAVMFGSVEGMQYLIDHGANIYLREKFSQLTLLHFSANDEKFKTDNRLHDEIYFNVNDTYAINRMKEKKFHILIDKGFDVNDSGNCGITPLLLASTSRNTDVVQILIKRGANVNFQSEVTAWTALHIALIKKNFKIVKILLDNGADVNCRGGIEQVTPLHLALTLNIKYSLGVYPNNIEKLDGDPCMITKEWPLQSEDIFNSNYSEFIAMLIENGADVNVRDTSGKLPLHLATLKLDIDAIRIILESGSKVNIQDFEGNLPLHNILENSYVEGFKLLLEFGADINDDDVIKKIMNGKDNLKNIAIEHATKMKLANLPIDQIYKPLILKSLHNNFYNQCLEEVIGLKSYYIGEYSLYKFLHLSTIRQCACVEKIMDSYESFKNKFPNYSSLITSVCRETVNRKSLIESAKIILQKTFGQYTTRLPIECIEHVLSFLNNRYLDVLAFDRNIDSNALIVEENRKVIKSSMMFTQIEKTQV